MNVPDGGCTGYKDVSWLGLQSASQPRLSYAEMAEDYPRYPDIHDLDLTLLNPRMIVVSRAVPVGPGPWRWPAACPARSRPLLVRVFAPRPGQGVSGHR